MWWTDCRGVGTQAGWAAYRMDLESERKRTFLWS